MREFLIKMVKLMEARFFNVLTFSSKAVPFMR